jgi:hypothetical protein
VVKGSRATSDGESVRFNASEEIQDLLDDLDHSLKRLRMEYEQFFLGHMKREPQVLRSKVQKTITKLVNEPPRNARQKFRFNTLNSQFQVYRQLWGRTMREIEAGTYKRDKFKARMNSEAAKEEATEKAQAREAASAGDAKKKKKQSSVDKLHGALLAARKKTGQAGGEPSRDQLDRMVKKQMDAIRAKHGDVKVKFKVVVENNKAKLKASVSK